MKNSFGRARAIPRRDALARIAAVPGSLLTLPRVFAADNTTPRPSPTALAARDDRFLDELERAAFMFFWEQANPQTGLVKDRNLADTPTDPRQVASIAATGFGLTALCIGAERRWVNKDAARARASVTLKFLRDRFRQEHGFFFHFVDARSGERVWNCEVSSIDTALLLCGVLTAGQYFQDAEIARLAQEIYDRVDWAWLLTDEKLLGHGWKPESGFLRARWDHYCEHMMIYLLAIGSSRHPVTPESWHVWDRPRMEYQGLRYIGGKDPLFVHQYSHAWFDFRHQRDRYVDYFLNSQIATEAHRRFCLSLQRRFPKFGEALWGITASDSAQGYVVWGGPPEIGKLDGTLVPCAPAGSLPFTPEASLRTLRVMSRELGGKVWRRYGFVDAFNPHTRWINRDVIGIDLGITLLMAENLRTGFVWKWFMQNPNVQQGMKLAGFSATS